MGGSAQVAGTDAGSLLGAGVDAQGAIAAAAAVVVLVLVLVMCQWNLCLVCAPGRPCLLRDSDIR